MQETRPLSASAVLLVLALVAGLCVGFNASSLWTSRQSYDSGMFSGFKTDLLFHAILTVPLIAGAYAVSLVFALLLHRFTAGWSVTTLATVAVWLTSLVLTAVLVYGNRGALLELRTWNFLAMLQGALGGPLLLLAPLLPHVTGPGQVLLAFAVSLVGCALISGVWDALLL